MISLCMISYRENDKKLAHCIGMQIARPDTMRIEQIDSMVIFVEFIIIY